MKVNIIKLFNLFLFLYFYSCVGFSQNKTNPEKRHEFGIDITNTLTFLKKNTQSYLLNYRFYTHDYAYRVGLNLDLSSGESEGYYPDIRIGIQKNKFDKSWNSYYGLDGSFSYYKSNLTPTSTTSLGLSPLIGVAYYFNKRISFSTEACINFKYFFSYNNDTFEIQKRKNYGRTYLGYIGMLVANYHF